MVLTLHILHKERVSLGSSFRELCSVVTSQHRGFTAFGLAAKWGAGGGRKHLEMEN